MQPGLYWMPGNQSHTAAVARHLTGNRVPEIISPAPLILAGGLTPGNVARRFAQPVLMRLMSAAGVESLKGIKSADKNSGFHERSRGQ